MIDPRLDLVLERIVDVSPELVWMAWTQPGHLKQWFTPAQWTTVECEIDLRPGGVFRTIMRSPEGKDFPNLGCYFDPRLGSGGPLPLVSEFAIASDASPFSAAALRAAASLP